MTVAAFDATALLGALVEGPARQFVVDELEHADARCASAIALTEALAAIDRLTDQAALRADLEDALRLLWDHLHVVPVDQRCLDLAARLARERPIRLADAVHFAAATRLPPPVRFVTLDPAQIGAAAALGFDVASP